MGYIAHDAVIAVIPDYVDGEVQAVEAFRADMPDGFAKYLLGPVVGVNGYTTFVFVPDGSKEGWEHSRLAESLRERFKELIERGDVVHVRFGGDFGSEIGTRVIDTTDPIIWGITS